MNNSFAKLGIWLVIGLTLFMLFNRFDGKRSEPQVTYSRMMEEAKAGKIDKVEVANRTLNVTTKDGKKFQTTSPGHIFMADDLMKYGVEVTGKPEEEPNALMTILGYLGPTILIIAFWFYMMRQMNGQGKGGPFSFGKSKAKMLDESANTVTFADVAGCDEAKVEVKEIVDFLKEPSRFTKLGGKIPRGLLMVGPPGTGKTLLAKAIAGEAKVPFFSISGSDFVEMFVGVGASRVRDMFEQARKSAPCIIFIDEIDAVGRARGAGAGMGGGNDEREQTLNQMLVEMDGFGTDQGIIVIAATNRPDVLDQALLRPGRFDRQVYVTLPDIRGREQVLAVHMRKIPIGKDINANVIARGTPGMSGADLANLCNEAALMAARRGGTVVTMADFEQAKDKIFMGPERRSAVIDPDDLKNTAYHESGHALLGKLLPKCDPVHKVTVIPRGRALGVTFSLPEKDETTTDADKWLQQISMLFGGRIAEEVFMNQRTTGASNDFERATKIARMMVMRFGMSDAMGPMVYVDDSGAFIAQSGSSAAISQETLQKADAEVRRILDQQYALARNLIESNKDKMHAMAAALLKYETIDSDQLDDIMAGRVCRPPVISDPAEPPSTDGGSASAPAQPVQTATA